MLLAKSEGGHQNKRVRVVRRADYECIEVLRPFVEHFPEVMVACGSRMSIERPGRTFVVEVAKSDDPFALTAGAIASPHAAYSHSGDGQSVARRLLPCSQDVAGYNQTINDVAEVKDPMRSREFSAVARNKKRGRQVKLIQEEWGVTFPL